MQSHSEKSALPAPSLVEIGAGSAAAFEPAAGVGYLSDPALAESHGVRFAFTMRSGGTSTGAYESLNLGSNVGDDTTHVQENRRRALSALGMEDFAGRLVNPVQVHGESVMAFVDGDKMASRLAQECSIAGIEVDARPTPPISPILDSRCDAVVTTMPGIPILLCYADCIPVVIVAPDGSFAVVHSGWRSAIRSIAGKAATVLSMATDIPTREFNAYIGPHIGACCYEVSDDLIDSFVSEFGSGCDAMGGHLDLEHAVRASLSRSGVEANRIVSADICVAEDLGRFYSHRAEGGKTGRFGALGCRIPDSACECAE